VEVVETGEFVSDVKAVLYLECHPNGRFLRKRLISKSRPFGGELSILGKNRRLLSKGTGFRFSCRNDTYSLVSRITLVNMDDF